MQTIQPNLVIAWLWIVMGFIFGAVLGLNFHREEWLGGYGSLKRRMYRLAHISFFGLAFVNAFFFFTVRAIGAEENADRVYRIASWGFVIGAVAMPLCCLLMAHSPKMRPLFVLPVSSLILAGILTLLKVVGL